MLISNQRQELYFIIQIIKNYFENIQAKTREPIKKFAEVLRGISIKRMKELASRMTIDLFDPGTFRASFIQLRDNFQATISTLNKLVRKKSFEPNKLGIKNDIMFQRIRYIVTVEHRPFSYQDFLDLMKHGTFRNKISKLRREGIVELVRNSHVTLYTLKGYSFGNRLPMTISPMDISSVIPVTGVISLTAASETNNFLGYLKSLNTSTNSIHDIHTKFTVPYIYRIVSSNPKYSKLINPVSKDIVLGIDIIEELRLSTTIHRTDTVTVSLGCTTLPIILDERGVTRLSCALTRIEERLSRRLDECGDTLGGGERIPMPDNKSWQVTLWHFGKDKFHNEFSAKGQSLTWANGREVLRTYIKEINGKKINRQERQEYPNKSIQDALDDKMGKINEIQKPETSSKSRTVLRQVHPVFDNIGKASYKRVIELCRKVLYFVKLVLHYYRLVRVLAPDFPSFLPDESKYIKMLGTAISLWRKKTKCNISVKQEL